MHINAELKRARNSSWLLCEVLDLLSRAARGATTVTGPELHTAIVKHAQRFLATYPEEEFSPKHHYALHLGAMLQHHKTLVSCWVHERRHKILKRYANALTNMRAGSEVGVLEQAALAHFHELEDMGLAELGLIGPKQPSKELQVALEWHFQCSVPCMVSTKACFAPSRWCGRGDVVLLEGGRVGDVWFHLDCSGMRLTCVSLYTEKVGLNEYLVSHNPCFVRTFEILHPCIHRTQAGRALIAPQLMYVAEE